MVIHEDGGGDVLSATGSPLGSMVVEFSGSVVAQCLESEVGEIAPDPAARPIVSGCGPERPLSVGD